MGVVKMGFAIFAGIEQEACRFDRAAFFPVRAGPFGGLPRNPGFVRQPSNDKSVHQPVFARDRFIANQEIGRTREIDRGAVYVVPAQAAMSIST